MKLTGFDLKGCADELGFQHRAPYCQVLTDWKLQFLPILTWLLFNHRKAVLHGGQSTLFRVKRQDFTIILATDVCQWELISVECVAYAGISMAPEQGKL